jgi:hypothetical protein
LSAFFEAEVELGEETGVGDGLNLFAYVDVIDVSAVYNQTLPKTNKVLGLRIELLFDLSHDHDCER